MAFGGGRSYTPIIGLSFVLHNSWKKGSLRESNQFTIYHESLSIANRMFGLRITRLPWAVPAPMALWTNENRETLCLPVQARRPSIKSLWYLIQTFSSLTQTLQLLSEGRRVGTRGKRDGGGWEAGTADAIGYTFLLFPASQSPGQSLGGLQTLSFCPNASYLKQICPFSNKGKPKLNL